MVLEGKLEQTNSNRLRFIGTDSEGKQLDGFLEDLLIEECNRIDPVQDAFVVQIETESFCSTGP